MPVRKNWSTCLKSSGERSMKISSSRLNLPERRHSKKRAWVSKVSDASQMFSFHSPGLQQRVGASRKEFPAHAETDDALPHSW